jgi:hypothetical protein
MLKVEISNVKLNKNEEITTMGISKTVLCIDCLAKLLAHISSYMVILESTIFGMNPNHNKHSC